MLARRPYASPALETVTIDAERRLYVIRRGEGVTCLGFAVVAERRAVYAAFCHAPPPCPEDFGTIEDYRGLKLVERLAAHHAAVMGRQCEGFLCPQLIGHEGKRVEVVDVDGDKRRFIVGRSTGWAPCHLEIKTRRSYGGVAADSRGYSSVTIIAERKIRR